MAFSRVGNPQLQKVTSPKETRRGYSVIALLAQIALLGALLLSEEW